MFTETFSVMARLPLLASLDHAACERYAPSCHVREFPRGTMLFHEHEPARGMYFVVDGVAKITRSTPEGREVVLFLVRKGQGLGESGVFCRNAAPHSTHATDAVAVTRLKVLYIPMETLESIVREHPDAALWLIESLSLRLRMFSHKIKIERQGNATRRLAAYLLHRDQLHGGSGEVRLEVSREVLANLLGLARETLSRQLTRLAGAGVIEFSGKVVRLLRKDELQRIATFGRTEHGQR